MGVGTRILHSSICKWFTRLIKSPFIWIKQTFGVWKRRIIDPDERRNYIDNNWRKILFMAFYILFNMALITYPIIIYWEISRKAFNWWVIPARIGGQMLNGNCAIILYPTMRTLLNILISLKFNKIIPLDKNLVFHRLVATVIAFAVALHAAGHYFSYSCCSWIYDPNPNNRQPGNIFYSSWEAMFLNKYGATGHAITIIMFIMYAASMKEYRRTNNFTVFWSVHHLFIIFYTLLLIHGKTFWLWLLPAGFFYILERVFRLVRGSTPTIVKRVHALKGDVLFLELEKPTFIYKAGQYCFLNAPLISRQEWHPFTISSSPDQEYLTFHIRVVGDWTKALMDTFNPTRKETLVIDKPYGPDGKTRLLRIDGPFGTSADYVFEYEYVMLCAAGIGVTPYASLLRQIKHRKDTGQPMKIKKCWFYWTNRDTGSFAWFSEFLAEAETIHPDFFEFHTFLTGALEAEKIKKIFFQSTEYTDKTKNIEVVGVVVSNYEAQSTDEIDLIVGESVLVTEKDSSGWWRGINQTTKEEGFFPSTNISVLDVSTGLVEGKGRHFGRPVWSEEFKNVRLQVTEMTPNDAKKRPKVGVFFCGAPAIGKQLKTASAKESKLGKPYFAFFKENF
eukprot:gene3020-5030_t